MKKYKLLDERRKDGLKRIVALKAFGNIRKGKKGGLVEGEKNLSQKGNAWVYENGRVFENAWVSGNARVYGDAWVSGNACVFGNARVYGDVQVYGNTWVYGGIRLKAGLLCSRFSFASNGKVQKWLKLENAFTKVMRT